MAEESLRRPSSRVQAKRGRGRPQKVPLIERRLEVRIEHYVMGRLAGGATLTQIAASLRVDRTSLRRWLRHRGYRVQRSAQLTCISTPRAERSMAAR